MPERLILRTVAGPTLFKPCLLPRAAGSGSGLPAQQPVLGIKIVSVRKQSVPATIVVLDAETGAARAVMGATALTAIRTAAISALATDLCGECRVNQSAVQLVAGRKAPPAD